MDITSITSILAWITTILFFIYVCVKLIKNIFKKEGEK